MAIRARHTTRRGRVYDVTWYERGKKRWKRGFGTRGEARTFEAHVRLGKSPASARLRTKDLLMAWLGSIEGHRAWNTERAYTYALKPAIRVLGDVSIRLLTPQRITDYLRGLAVKASTAHVYAVALKAALSWGVRMKYLPTNPMTDVELPRVERAEHRVMDEEQMRLFLAKARPSRYYVMYCLGLGAGLGMAECLGLEWRDVDLVFGRVTVRRGKTKMRRRTVALPEFVRESMVEQRERAVRPFREANRGIFAEGSDRRPCLRVDSEGLTNPALLDLNTPVFLSGFSPLTVEERVRTDLRAYTPLTFHELRHSHATALLVAGEPLKVVSERLGHASIRITADTYQHVLPGMDERAAARMDELLGKAVSRKTGAESPLGG